MEEVMRPVRLSLILLPALLGGVVAGCSVRTETTERVAYAPTATPARAVVYPTTGYYYYPTTTYYYREPYHPAYYSSY
jgi:hypothetical protein